MRILFRYAKANWLFASVGMYMLFSCILKLATGINITIPCLIKTFTGRRCPGCGLTHAFMDLIQLNPLEAWEHNPFIFLVIPTGCLLISIDFLRFRKRIITSTS